MRNETIDETNNATIAKQYTDWMTKTGGYARDMTMRDHYSALAMQAMMTTGFWNWEKPNEDISRVYAQADAMLKERTK